MKVYRNLALFATLATVLASTAAKSTEGSTPEKTCNAEIDACRNGTCPPPHQAGFCAACNDICRSDNDCPDIQKCCYQPGCGNFCREPVLHGQ